MRKTPLKRIGKVGEANILARKRIAEIAEEKGLNYCELALSGCMRTSFLAPAHRHRRGWYHGDAELLSDFQQWIVACQPCHQTMDANADLLEGIFEKLRPPVMG